MALLLLTATASRVFGHFSAQDADFRVYYAAARVVHADRHGDLFAGATSGEALSRVAPADSPLALEAQRAGIQDVLVYLYPPLLADLLTPLSPLSARTAAAVWRLLNYGLLLLVLLYLRRAPGFPQSRMVFAALLIGACAYFPIIEAIASGQITIVLLALWTVAVVAYGRGDSVVCALALALATALKVTPILAVPLFFIWKDRGWLLTYFSATIGLFVLMVLVNGELSVVNSVRVMAAAGSSMPSLQIKTLSALPLEAWTLWHAGGAHGDQVSRPSSMVFLAGRLVAAVFYAACLYSVWRRRAESTRAERAGALAIFSTVSLLASPVAWRHAYTVFLLPLAELWRQALSELGGRVDVFLVTAASVVTGSVLLDSIVGSHLPFAVRLVAESGWTVVCSWLCLRALMAGFSFYCSRRRNLWGASRHLARVAGGNA